MSFNKILFLTGIIIISACSKSKTENNFLSQNLNDEASQEAAKSANSSGDVELTATQLNKDLKFFIHKGIIPKKDSVDYFSIVEKKPDSNTRMLFVDGIVVRIADGSQTDINTTQGLTIVEINAEELIIERPLHFPGASVVINARSLVFKGNGSLSIAPNNVSTIAELTSDGKNGQDAGSITLNVESIDLGEEKKRIILSGGNGQDAGLGIPGKAGISVADFGDGIVGKCVTMITLCSGGERSGEEISRSAPKCNTQVPTNGEKGILAGAPGAGGDGGVLIVKDNVISKEYIEMNSGKAGAIARKTKGGLAGNPKVYFENYTLEYQYKNCSNGGGGGKFGPKNYPGFVGKIKIGEVFDGEDLDSPIEPKEVGKVGLVKVKSDLKLVPSSKLLNHRLTYAKDLYRNNYFEEALNELLILEKKSSENTEALSLLINKESMQLVNQLKSHKDIDGFAINHVPDLSLPKIISAYDAETKRAFATLHFTSEFLRNVHSVKEKSDKLKKKKNDLSDEMVDIHNQNRSAHEELVDAMRLISEVESIKLSFDEALKNLEKEIESEAQRNIHSKDKKRKLLGSIKLIANLAKVFPAGQPAVGAIGTGIDSIVAMSEKEEGSWQDRVQEGYETYGNLRKSLASGNWSKSKEDWNTNYSSLFYQKFKEANPDIKGKRFEKYLKETIEKTKPLYSEVNKYYKDVYSRQIPKSEYEAEIQRLKNEHSGFQFVLTKLESLQRKKEELDNQINKNMAIINSTESAIYNLFVAIEASEVERMELLDGLNFDVEDSIKFLSKRAKQRLKDYKNLLIKAYNYRLLIPYKGSYDLEKIEDEFKDFSRSNGEKIDIRIIEDLYKEDLAQIANGILTSLDTGTLREYEASISYELNLNELQALSSGKSIYINPIKKGLIQSDEENQRVVSIVVDSLDSSLVDDRKLLDISIEQVGKVEMERYGNIYAFAPTEKSNIWKSRFDPVANSLSAISESNSMGTLFDVLFPNSPSNTELYAKPALRANYLIKVSENLKELKNLRIVINYTYSIKK